MEKILITLFCFISGAFAGFMFGIFIMQRVEKKRLSLLGSTIVEGHFQNKLLCGVAMHIFKKSPESIFEVNVDKSVWRVFYSDNDIKFRKKE